MDFIDFNQDDLETLKSIFQNGEIMRYTLDDTYSDQEAATYLDRILKNNKAGAHRKQYEYKVAAGGEFIGFADLEIIREMQVGGIAEIGYLLLPAYWRKGYGTAICKELIGFCFGELKMHKVVASCSEDNAASWRVMEKCGMQREGRLLNHRYKNGAFAHELKYAVFNPKICR